MHPNSVPPGYPTQEDQAHIPSDSLILHFVEQEAKEQAVIST